MIMKILILISVGLILYSLGSGFFYLVRDGGASVRLGKAMLWRSVLSLALFALVVVGYYMGWIMPHGIGM